MNSGSANFHLTKIVFHGLSWGAAANLIRQLLNFVIGVILARVLIPDEFGLLGMVLVFAGLANLFVGQGMGAVIIQKQNLEKRHLDSLFWLNLVLGFFCCILFTVASPWIADFYNEPVLRPLVKLFSLTFILNALNVVPNALLNKHIESRKLAVAETGAIFFSGIAGISLALGGWGVWSLVWQAILLALLTTVFTWLVTPWRPRIYFDPVAIKDTAGYTLHLLGCNFINYLERNFDNLLIGRFISAYALGLYTRAYQLMLLPLSQVSWVAARVFFPVLSAMQQDQDRTRRIYLQATRGVALITFPLMIGLLMVSRPFVLCLYGEKWSGMILLLQILCLVGMMQSIATTFGWIYNSQGRTDLQLKLGVLSAIVTLTAFIIGLRWGVVGVAIAYVVEETLLFYPTWAIPGTIINLRISEMLKNLTGPFLCAAGMGGVICLCEFLVPRGWDAWQYLAVEVSIGIAVYVTLAHIFKIRAYLEIKQLIFNGMRSGETVSGKKLR